MVDMSQFWLTKFFNLCLKRKFSFRDMEKLAFSTLWGLKNIISPFSFGVLWLELTFKYEIYQNKSTV